jgi:hypothetical protein
MILQGGCSDKYDGPNYVITGGVWNNPAFAMHFGGSITVRESIGGEGLPGATVTVNGSSCNWSPIDLEYRTSMSPVPPGDNLLVEVELGEFHALALLMMPDGPIITAPSGSYDAASPITIEWSTSFTPDRFEIGIHGDCVVTSTDLIVEVDGAQTSFEIPAGTLKPGMSDIMLTVSAVNETADMGAYAGSGSLVSATSYGGSPLFSTN